LQVLWLIQCCTVLWEGLRKAGSRKSLVSTSGSLDLAACLGVKVIALVSR